MTPANEFGWKHYFCGHCKHYVYITVLYLHKRLHFEHKSKKWSKERLYFDKGAYFVPALASTVMFTDDETGHDSANTLIEGASEIQPDTDFV